MSKKFTPEFELFVRESRLGLVGSILYDVFPVGAQRLLGRLLPNSKTLRQVLEVTDFREKYCLPPGYVPPQLGYKAHPSRTGNLITNNIRSLSQQPS